jgi:hypothetical protein
LRRVAIFCGASLLVACAGIPPIPDIEVKLVDQKNGKIHYYLVPKQNGQKAQYLRSVPLTFSNLNKNFAIDPKNYSVLEGYISEVEDYAKEKCK